MRLMPALMTILLLAGALPSLPAVARPVRAAKAGISKPAATPAAKPAAIAPLPDTEEVAQLRRAFRFAFPIYEIMRTRAGQLGRARAAGLPNGVNIIFPRAKLAGPDDRDVTTPNNDTLYGSAWLDLAGGPVILTVPALGGRYNSAALMSIQTDNTAILGSRSGGGGGRYAIVGPDYNGPAPQGTELVRSASNDAWLLIRVLVDGPDDLGDATTALQGFKLEPGEGRADAVPTAAEAPVRPDARTFLAAVNEALARAGGSSTAVARAAAFAAQGVGVPWETISPDLRKLWSESLPALHDELKGGLAKAGDVVDGWSYPGLGVGDAGSDDDLRAYVALGGLAALPRIEAMYLTARTDKDGAPLTGAKSWRVRIPARIPVGAFWSLTMYEADAEGRLFYVANELDRYAVGNRSKHLRPDRDGSYEIFVQAGKPSGERVINWLPAPKGKFVLVFRGYLPRAEFLDGSFRLPPLTEDEVIP